MTKAVEFTTTRFEIVLTTHTVLGGNFKSEDEAMKAVPAMLKLFGGEFVKINRREIPHYWLVTG